MPSENGDNGLRFWWAELKPLLVRLFWGHPLRRFFTLVFLAGVSMLTPSLLELLVLLAGDLARPAPDQPADGTSVLERVSIALIVIGIVGNVVLYAIELRSESAREEQTIVQRARRLAGYIDAIAHAYEDRSVRKEPGHFAEQKSKAKALASSLRDGWHSPLIADRVFVTVCEAPICTSGFMPYLDTTPDDLKRLAARLRTEAAEDPP